MKATGKHSELSVEHLFPLEGLCGSLINLELYGKPEAIRMDNGPELTSQSFEEWTEKHKIRLIFIQPGKPNQNAFIERFTEVLELRF